ncbi:MAG TPA: cation-translocating P-type ATPase [Aquabacterium sp.]|uniref:cation-translocating P-type ATPase n=1 Tax=Aquabacterium sp. TaxID=1872578 RepID=UPI002E33C68C|nr:cation-translocating P-type ATPase [Aquabacterium sp.]HEX5356619.1 cation-translocating P-type ATPase [Aquabacterium sp.]
MPESIAPTPSGLSDAEAQARWQQHGPNELPQASKRTAWRIALELVREPMLQLLLVAGGIYLALGDIGEACMLLAFVALTLVISFVQEARTERVLEALRDLSSPRALVIRNGERKRIPGREVVPGDLLLLEEGDRVPADARLLSANDFLADESLLTGEPVPVRKLPWLTSHGAARRPGGDDQPWVYSGSMVVRGLGMAEVTATGAHSELGRIGVALHQIEQAPPALQQQTRALVRTFAVIGISLSVVVALLYVWMRGDVLAAVLAGITLAMSLLPQEFPLILTVFMAMGAWRISQQRVLVRRASAIEALGTATVLCTDKTGTLTLNRMTIAAMHVNGQTWRAQETSAPLPEAFHALLLHGILASERDPFDPMEKAFWVLGQAQLPQQLATHAPWQLVHEYGLSTEMLAMSHVWQAPQQDGHLVATKGAPEAIADLCHLDEAALAEVRRVADVFASQGMRVLGVARARHDGPRQGGDWPAVQHDFDFEFMGLVALQDPLRPDVPQAVQACREAGIKVIMITGDHPATAKAMADQAGLDVHADVVRGEDLQGLSDEALKACVARASVFARVMPEQKLRIVQALQAQGHVVAMTGDGVNDAPSLKAADIGVAMGSRGTDVAREASAMVLLDDDFGAIVKAVQLGRRIDDNLRKAMAFVLAVHVPIAGLTLLPLLMGWPLLFMPVHIAFLELIIDPVCSIVFEAEPDERDIMRRPPREIGRPLLTRAMMLYSLTQGLLALCAVGLAYAWLLQQGLSEPQARAGGFVSLIAVNILLIVNNRSLHGHVMSGLLRPNPALWRMLALTVGLLGVVLFVPALSGLFKMVLPGALGAMAVVGALLGTLVFLQILRWFPVAKA